MTKCVNSLDSEKFDFENDAILIENSCPKKIVIQMIENGYIEILGKGYKIGEKRYPAAHVNDEWLESIEEI